MAKLRFSLRTLMILTAAISLVLAIVFVLTPALWALATETESARKSSSRLLAACFAFSPLLGPALLVRVAMAVRRKPWDSN